MKDVYFISGLGVDERIFQYLNLEDVHIRYVRWIPPEPQDTMGSYAKRLLGQIHSPRPILIGMSMGGMIAVEISKLIETERVILISSAKTKEEIPLYFQFLHIFKLHKWLPYHFLTRMGILLGGWLFGTFNKAEKRLLNEIIYDTDETFFRWAWEQVICWRNEKMPRNVFHMHGDMDHVLPIEFIRVHRIIHGGTHLMVVNKAEEISSILQELITGNK